MRKFLFWQPENFTFNPFLFFFSHWFLWLAILALTIWWWSKKRYTVLFFFWSLLLISEVIEMFIKHFVFWERPFYTLGTVPPDWIMSYSRGSFPSGHAIRSVILFFYLNKINKRLFWVLMPAAVLTNLGRILFGLHYPIDIIGGIIIGLCLVGVQSFGQYWRSKA